LDLGKNKWGHLLCFKKGCGLHPATERSCEAIGNGFRSAAQWTVEHTPDGVKEWGKGIAQNYREGAAKSADKLYELHGIPKEQTLQAARDLVFVPTQLALYATGYGVGKVVSEGMFVVEGVAKKGFHAFNKLNIPASAGGNSLAAALCSTSSDALRSTTASGSTAAGLSSSTAALASSSTGAASSITTPTSIIFTSAADATVLMPVPIDLLKGAIHGKHPLLSAFYLAEKTPRFLMN